MDKNRTKEIKIAPSDDTAENSFAKEKLSIERYQIKNENCTNCFVNETYF